PLEKDRETIRPHGASLRDTSAPTRVYLTARHAAPSMKTLAPGGHGAHNLPQRGNAAAKHGAQTQAAAKYETAQKRPIQRRAALYLDRGARSPRKLHALT